MSEIELMRQAKQFEYANLTIKTEFDDLQQTHEKYAAYLDTLMTLHLSEKWRRDTYFIKHNIGPLVASINDAVDHLLNDALEEVVSTGHALAADLKRAASAAAVLLRIGLLLGVVISTSCRKRYLTTVRFHRSDNDRYRSR